MRMSPGRSVGRRVGGSQGRLSAGDPALFPTAEPIRPAALPVLDQRLRGTTYFEHPVGSILNPPETTGMGYWSLNPYVGCEFGCTYCYARYTHRFTVERAERAGRLDPPAGRRFQGEEWRAFEHRIFVKQKEAVLAALEKDLATFRRRAADAGTSIVIGTATDPYQPAERRFRITRAVLERLARERGFSLGVISKSTLVCRDIELFLELQRRHALSIHVSLISADAALVKLFEARSPLPHTRFRALKRLTDAGVCAGLMAAPVLPAITDAEAKLDALLAGARAAGARFASYGPLRLYQAVQPVFLPVIDEHFPRLAARYRSAFLPSGYVTRAYRRALSARFHKLAGRHGVPIYHAMRDEGPAGAGPVRASLVPQLSLWRS
jgi:DNA repair photolyase